MNVVCVMSFAILEILKNKILDKKIGGFLL